MAADSLRGRTALVTGGSRGIGAAVSRALAEAGAAVAVNYREQAEQARKLVDELHKQGVQAITAQADVSRADAVARMVESVKSEFGTIDILVNNAGIAITRAVDDLTEADFDRTIAVNLKSVFLCTQAVLPLMRARKWGHCQHLLRCGARRGRDRPALQCLQGRYGGTDARLRGAACQGRHHGQCGCAVLDRNGHDEGSGQSRQPDTPRPPRQTGRGRDRRNDADPQSLYDRPDSRDERRHGVQLEPHPDTSTG